MKVFIRPRAEHEMAEAVLKRSQATPQAGLALLRAFESTVERIQKFPRIAPLYFGTFRRALLPNSQYGLFYEVEDDLIIVHAVLHLAQDEAQLRKDLMS